MSAGSIELETQLIERVVERRNSLLAEAEERAKRIVESAEREVKRIEEEAEEQIYALIGNELRAIRDRVIGRAELEGRKMMMLARQEMLSAVFGEARERLKAIAEGEDDAVDYGEVLIKLIIEAASAIGGEEFEVAANRRDLAFLRKNLRRIGGRLKRAAGGELRLAEKPIDVIGGVVVRNREGTKLFYNTLEGRLEKVRSRAEAEIGKILGLI